MNLQKETEKVGSVMVVGAGVAGIQASLDMANAGYYVHLVDNSTSVGGLMAQLDKTFPTNDCAMCVISPFLVEVGRHLNINIISNSEVESLEGRAGAFQATVRNDPRYIDIEKCTACGQCRQVCPVTAINEFDCGLDLRKATYIKYPQAVPLAYAIDRGACIGCGLCEKVCLAEAISYGDSPRRAVLDVGAVILAMGNSVYDPTVLDTLAYGRHPNVVTSLEFERILSASGPYKGHLMRPFDREIPEKIAWLQCVGSRDINRACRGYCSSVCCMYAIKQTMIAKEHASTPLDTAVFYMDMRTYGKDFDKYYTRAKDEKNVRFIRSRIHTIEPLKNGDLNVRYILESGQMQEEAFNMVVLSVGLSPPQSAIELAGRLDIDLNGYNYARTADIHPVSTSREGVYVCGAFQGPKDIPQSVMEASAAAAEATEALSDARWSRTLVRDLPIETDFSGQEPRIGVFVCNCGINIGGIVNVPEVREYARSLPNVVHVEDNLFTCSQDTQVKMAEIIKEKGINRMVVAACTPLTHEALFRETLTDVGLNKYLFEMANIRNQDSWVHMNDPRRATNKAKDLVRMSVARAALLQPLQEKTVEVNQRAVVIGGGVAGMSAALNLAEQGYEAIIVEKERELGGMARNLYHTIEGADVQQYVASLVEKVHANEKIQVLTEALVVNFSGYKGNFTTEVLVGPIMYERKIKHGATVVATGAQEYRPTEFLYGQHRRVMTQVELGKHLHDNGSAAKDWQRVVFIQCVGSRNPENPNCSRICCQGAVKHALHLKELNPDTEILVLYRDMRMYGMLEDYYQQARKAGIVFSRFRFDQLPEVAGNGDELRVTFMDHVLQRPVQMSVDALVLSAATVASDTEELASLLKLPRNAYGFFIEAHAKLRPVDFASEGIFLCGTAHGPKLISESIAQGLAAASRAGSFLANTELRVGGAIARVDPSRCAACLVCVMSCPYGVPRVNEDNVSEINEALCQGCGVCVSECPAKTIRLDHFRDDQIAANVRALLEGAM